METPRSVGPPGAREDTFNPRCGVITLTQDSLQRITCAFLEAVGAGAGEGWELRVAALTQVPCNGGEFVMVQKIMLALWGSLSPQASKAWPPRLAEDWPHQALLPLPGRPGLDAVLAPPGNSRAPREGSSGGCSLASHCWLAGRRWAGRLNITLKINEEAFQPLLDYSFIELYKFQLAGPWAISNTQPVAHFMA